MSTASITSPTVNVEALRTPDDRFVGLPGFPFAPHYREWEGIRLAHLDEGEGPPVVMLHGQPSWSFLYRKAIPALVSAGHRCVAPDLPGFGRSDKPLDEDWYSYDRHTAAIASLLVDLDLQDVCLVMHDWGGPIGLRVAMIEASERVSRLVVMDSGVLTGRREMGPTWRAFRDMVCDMPDFPVGRIVRMGTRHKPSRDVIAAYDAPFPDVSSKAGVRAFPGLVPLTPEAPGALAGQATLEILHDDERPALLLWADSDPMFPVESFAAEMHEQFGLRSELHVIEDAGHFLQEDHGEQIGRRIADWLASTPAAQHGPEGTTPSRVSQPTEPDDLAAAFPTSPPLAHADLGFERTISRESLHKRSVEEVFVTDVRLNGQEAGAIAAQLPRSHSLYCELADGHHDLLLLLEVGRQGMTFFGHGGLDAAKDMAFVMASIEAEVVDLDAMRRTHAPSPMTLHVPPGEARRNGKGRLRSYTMQGAGYIDSRLAIIVRGTAILIPASLYERARRVPTGEVPAEERVPSPVDPMRVGRHDPRNVVVSDLLRERGRWTTRLVVDPAHPSFFDHELDHVPGMLMLEAARQAAMLLLADFDWDPRETILDRCEARLTQYAALSPAVSCCMTLSSDAEQDPKVHTMRASFTQSAHDLGYIELRMRRVALATGTIVSA
jgi:haloalkane dehalogenase